MATKKKPGTKRSGGKKGGAEQQRAERNVPETEERQIGQYSGQGTPPLQKK